mmetsp:Transcript_10452/g.28590  ORF Transcript_10452/g.28590 Transcript_10452/m.28590 type:complete len:361 (+) Transcript_10452:4605-5687(+)
MPNSEHLALDPVQPNAQTQVVLGIRHVHDLLRIDTTGRLDHRQRITLPPLVLAQRLESPRLDRLPGRAPEPVVPRHHVRHTLLPHQPQALAHSIEHLQLGRVGHIPARIRPQHIGKVIVHPLALTLLARLNRLVTGHHHRQPSRQTQRLLGPRHGHIHTPLVKLKVQRPDRTHTIDQKHRRVVVRIHRLTHTPHVGRHPRRRLIVHHADRLDLFLRIRLQHRRQTLLVRTISPPAVNHLNIQPKTLHHIDPQVREQTVTERHHLVTWVERVRQRRLPTTRAGPGPDDARARRRRLFRLKNHLDLLQTGLVELGEERIPVILPTHMHRPQHRVRNVHRTRHKQVITTRGVVRERRAGTTSL